MAGGVRAALAISVCIGMTVAPHATANEASREAALDCGAAPNALAWFDQTDDVPAAAPDLVTLTACDDGADVVTLRLLLRNRRQLERGDLIGIYLDTDLNRETGDPTGSDYALFADARVAPKMLRIARWTGTWSYRTPSARFEAADEAFFVTFTFSVSDIGGSREFVLGALGSSTRAAAADMAGFGDWRYPVGRAGNLPGGPPPVGPPDVPGPPMPDMTPPVVRALPSSGRAGAAVRLRYTVADTGGNVQIQRTTREQIRVLRGGRMLWTRTTRPQRLDESAIYHVVWRAPGSARGRVRFCVRAWDADGNGSAPSCARLTLR